MIMNRTRQSLLYLATYLTLIGIGLLLLPEQTLKLLQSNGEYGNIFPRVAGMLMSGMGLSVVGIFRAGVPKLYPATLFIRTYFLCCIAVFYSMSKDPLFLVLLAIVSIGFLWTLTAYLMDRSSSTR
jgi:hypothetical protein